MNNLIVLIRFGDNDFYDTFIPALYALTAWYGMVRESWEEQRFHDRANLCRLINTLTPPAYEFVQSHRGDIDDLTTSYIQITEDMLLLGDEVDEFLINNMKAANGAWFVLDTRLPEDQQVFHV